MIGNLDSTFRVVYHAKTLPFDWSQSNGSNVWQSVGVCFRVVGRTQSRFQLLLLLIFLCMNVSNTLIVCLYNNFYIIIFVFTINRVSYLTFNDMQQLVRAQKTQICALPLNVRPTQLWGQRNTNEKRSRQTDSKVKKMYNSHTAFAFALC